MSHKLSQKLVQSPAFKWMPGMLAGLPNNEGKIVVWMRIVSVRRNAITASVDRYEGTNPRVFLFEREHWDKTPPAIDPDDPGTMGCLLALLSDATRGEGRIGQFEDNRSWWVDRGPQEALCESRQLGEALAQALIAAGGDQ